MALGKDKKLRKAFSSIREEFDMHLDSINTNTEEIFENRAMILAGEERNMKRHESLAESLAFLRQEVASLREENHQLRSAMQDLSAKEAPAEPEWPEINLTLREQEVFLALYTASDALSYTQLSSHLSLPVSLVRDLTFSMIQKNVPIVKRHDGRGDVLVSIDIEFAELQSKKNIVGIDKNLSVQLSKDLQLSLLE